RAPCRIDRRLQRHDRGPPLGAATPRPAGLETDAQTGLNDETQSMLENRNTILAVILSGLVLIAWQYFYNVPQMERQRAQTQSQAELAKSSPQATPGTTTTPQPGATPSAGAPAGQPAQPVVSRSTAIAATPRVKIETPRLSGSISL